MTKIRRAHCNIRHLDAYLIEYDDGRIAIRCPQHPYCNECHFEKGIEPKKQKI